MSSSRDAGGTVSRKQNGTPSVPEPGVPSCVVKGVLAIDLLFFSVLVSHHQVRRWTDSTCEGHSNLRFSLTKANPCAGTTPGYDVITRYSPQYNFRIINRKDNVRLPSFASWGVFCCASLQISCSSKILHPPDTQKNKQTRIHTKAESSIFNLTWSSQTYPLE